jgi:N-acetylglucosamine malate deacetylase 1
MMPLGLGERAVIVAAHPDDEMLGAGGFLLRYGILTTVIAVADCVSARGTDPVALEQRRAQFAAVCKAVGAEAVWLGWPGQSLRIENSEVRTSVEHALARLAPPPAVVLTHCASDLNADHRMVAEAVQIAARPLTALGRACRLLLGFRIDPWSHAGSAVAPESIALGLLAEEVAERWRILSLYEAEVSPQPHHPRSPQALEAQARVTGVRFGVEFAEAYSLYRAVL